MPSVANIITAHNKRSSYLTPDNNRQCNCRSPQHMSIGREMLDDHIVYLCNIKNANDEGANYIGSTENTFKDRWYKHRNSFKYESKANLIELSKYFWELKKNGTNDPILPWSILDRTSPYVNGAKKCNLCITEKYHIIFSRLSTINKRNELISKCRHENKFYFFNYKVVPQDI